MKVTIWLFIAMVMVLIGMGTQSLGPTQPSNLIPRIQTHYSFGIDAKFSTEMRTAIVTSLREYNRVGLQFTITNSSNAAFQIKSWYNRANNRIGEYHPDSATIFIDLSRVTTKIQLQALLIHEVGHFLGMRHICEFPGEDADCSNIGYGMAIMNPILYPNHIMHLSSLDLEELIRTYGVSASSPHNL